MLRVTHRDIWAAAMPLMDADGSYLNADGEPLKQGERPISASGALLTKPWHRWKVTYWLNRLDGLLQRLLPPIEKARLALLEQYGAKTATGIRVDITGPNGPEFMREFNELMDEPVKLHGVRPIRLPDTDFPLPLIVLRAMDAFIETEDEMDDEPEDEPEDAAEDAPAVLPENAKPALSVVQ